VTDKLIGLVQYAKCSAAKLWNRGNVWVHRNEQGSSSLWMASPSVSVSKPWPDVQRPPTLPGIHAQAVESLGMEPSSALLHRKSNMLTPYNPEACSGGSHCLISLRDTQPCTIVLFMALMLASIQYLKHMSPLITHPFLSTPKFTMRLWRMSFRRGDTLAPFHRPNLRPLLALSSPRPFPWFPNQANQENSMWSMTSHTHIQEATYMKAHLPTTAQLRLMGGHMVFGHVFLGSYCPIFQCLIQHQYSGSWLETCWSCGYW